MLSTMYILSILGIMVICLTGSMIMYPMSEIWGENMYLASMGWGIVLFIIREQINMFLLSRSTLFGLLPRALQKQDSYLLTNCYVSLLLYIPTTIILIWELLSHGPNEFLKFVPVTRCLLAMGIIGEIIDLVTKYKVPVYILVHHSLEIIGGSLMIEGNLRSLEPGFCILAATTVFGKFQLISSILDHIGRGGISDKFVRELYISPKFLGRLYFYSGVYGIIHMFIMPCFLMGIYMFKYWGEIEEVNRVYLLVLLFLFSACGIPFTSLILRRSKEKYALDKSLDKSLNNASEV